MRSAPLRAARIGSARIGALAVIAAFLLSGGVATGAADDGRVTVLKAARLYDGKGNEPVTEAVVVVRENRIVAVGKASEIAVPADAAVIDLGDDTLMPGLFDTHGHLRYRYSGGGAAGRTAQATAGHGPLAMLMVKNARTQLLTGITTMRMTGEVALLDFEIKKAIDSGMIPGPRIIPSGRLITGTGGHGGYEQESQVDGTVEVVKAVRENFHHGARLIKLAMMDLSPNGAQMSFEEVKAAVDTAHASGVPVTVHCTGNWGSCIRISVEAGADTIEHARPLNEKIIELLKSHGTSLSLTPLVYIGFRPNAHWWNYLDHEVDTAEDWIMFMRREMIEWRQAHPEWETADRPYEDNESGRAQRDYFPGVKNMQREALNAYRAGIPIGLGLDTIYGGVTLTMEWMVEAGVPLEDVIHMATGSAAAISGEAHRLGTLEPGKLADIISIKGDPAAQITNLHKIHLIMKDGERVDGLSWN